MPNKDRDFSQICGIFAPEFEKHTTDMLKGAIFDMDGVLVDNMKIHMEAFAAIARRYGAPVDIYTVLGMAGKGNDQIFREIFHWSIGVRAHRYLGA